MMIAIAVMSVLLGLALLGFGVFKRVARNRAGNVRRLKNPEWSATVYGCAESRAEF